MKNILVPRNIESRKEKLRQHIIKLLSQDVIEYDDLVIDETFEGIDDELVNVKEIKGDVWLEIRKGYIPLWLKNVKIYGSFSCSNNNLTSLENCPQYVNGYFSCSWNKLKSLERCPKYIGDNIFCYNNKEKLELPEGIELKGRFINN